MARFKALIVDDNAQFGLFLRSALEERTPCQVIGVAVDGLEALEKAHELQPDLILLDLGLPKLNGMEVLKKVRQLVPGAKVLVVSQESSPEIIQAAMRHGAHGYLLKSDTADLPMAVQGLLLNEGFVSFEFFPHVEG
ncbi:response regulator [Occallatibacter riparius]|uniref:Response regulator transcription factor n=1 Tax=Occallatibacter riparius TaxID=1002689 RepID=A0A9J7BW24_9BACT|nr:response regulator transcription factor [Occallatibacter riparius]UWZ86840.1 response regulator transcription factor [Occallatibacter riparius]